jgi:tetratricopeptide (TPR) repeat protein
MKNILLPILIIVFSSAYSQIGGSFLCRYTSTSNFGSVCNFLDGNSNVNDYNILKQVKNILNVVGLPQNFNLVLCSDIDNAFAFTGEDGIRYIVVDRNWIGNISNNDWHKISILAHEIGHHLSGHTIKKTFSYSESRQQEIEADKFSGFILSKLGASLIQAQSAINYLVSNNQDDTYSTHPTKSKRLKAIQDGFYQTNVLVTTPSLESAENYFNIAYYDEKAGNIASAIYNYKKAIEINTNYSEAYTNLGSLLNANGYDVFEAFNYLSKAVKVNPNNSIAYHNMGEIFLERKGYEPSIKEFNFALKINPYQSSSYVSRGTAYYHLRYYNFACSDWSTACNLGNSMGCKNLSFFCR